MAIQLAPHGLTKPNQCPFVPDPRLMRLIPDSNRLVIQQAAFDQIISPLQQTTLVASAFCFFKCSRCLSRGPLRSLPRHPEPSAWCGIGARGSKNLVEHIHQTSQQNITPAVPDAVFSHAVRVAPFPVAGKPSLSLLIPRIGDPRACADRRQTGSTDGVSAGQADGRA